MTRPFVTVLIDTYNHERFIEHAVESVLQQDFPATDTEILVVDDGSTDRTAALVEKFVPRVRLLRKPNAGQASAFNAGIPESRGQVLAFLDGDDWWAQNKLTSVVRVFEADPQVGLVGHAVVHVSPDNSTRTEAPREVCRFRIGSASAAKKFRMQRGFFGTSRMALRRDVLREIGPVPESLRFEADEYLFTIAALLADAVILTQALTFYRLHDKNLFQLSATNVAGLQAKQRVLQSLAGALEIRMKEIGVAQDVAAPILEAVRLESDLLRLLVEGGFPWETVATEWKIMRVFHADASVWQHLFSCARLAPALLMPARAYYRYRRLLADSKLYRLLRSKTLPFPVPRHIERRDKPAT